MAAKLYLLKPGRYRMTLEPDGPADAKAWSSQDVTVAGPRTRVGFELPPRWLAALRVRAKARER